MKALLERIEHFPVSFFSIVMGLAGFAIATKRIEMITELSLGSPYIASFALLVFAILAFLYGLKMLRFSNRVREEFDHPVKLHFFPAISISLLLLAIAFLHISHDLATVFWAVGAPLHLVFSFAVVSIWIRNANFHPEHLNPSWFIPIVGNILVPIAGVFILPGSYLWFFFSIGILFWLILVTLLINRTIFFKAMPEKLVPTFFIMIAPPAVGVISYVLLTGVIDPFTYVLYFFALFLALLFLGNAPMFAKIRFALSWWAYSFPLAALTISSALIFMHTTEEYFRSLSLIVFAILTIVVVALLIRTGICVRKRGICIEED
jgi:tellurite resistance protein